jgi:hypothetical protein
MGLSYFSLLGLQPFVCRGFSSGSGGFIIVGISGMVLLAPRPTPNPLDKGLHFLPLPFDLSGMGGSVRSLRSRQHSSPIH